MQPTVAITDMQIYYIINTVASNMFRPPIVAIFRQVVFEGYITQYVKCYMKVLISLLIYQILIKLFLLKGVFVCCVYDDTVLKYQKHECVRSISISINE